MGTKTLKTDKPELLKDIILLVRSLFHKLARAGSKMHGVDSITIGQRAILEDLKQNGRQTIPALAAKRPVCRQHILKLVNALLQRKLVRYEKNPAHRRSFLVTPTPTGKSQIEKWLKTEEKSLESIAKQFASQDLYATAHVLKKLEQALLG